MKKFKDKKELRKELKSLFNNDELDDALSLIVRHQSLVQSDAQLLFDKGLIIHLSDSDEFSVNDVMDSYKQALEVDPDFLPPRMELAWALLKGKKTEEALENFTYILDNLKVMPVIYLDAYEGFLACTIELRGKRIARTHCRKNRTLLMPQKRELWQRLMKSYFHYDQNKGSK